MSDRGFLFLFSCAVILASLGAAGWLAVTGQAATVDGLFLLLTCVTVAFAFALYVKFLIQRAMESGEQPAKPAKAAAAASPAKTPPLVPAEKTD